MSVLGKRGKPYDSGVVFSGRGWLSGTDYRAQWVCSSGAGYCVCRSFHAGFCPSGNTWTGKRTGRFAFFLRETGIGPDGAGAVSHNGRSGAGSAAAENGRNRISSVRRAISRVCIIETFYIEDWKSGIWKQVSDFLSFGFRGSRYILESKAICWKGQPSNCSGFFSEKARFCRNALFFGEALTLPSIWGYYEQVDSYLF